MSDLPPPIPHRLKNTLKRDQIPSGACLCDHCAGKCCRYFTLPIEAPITWADFEEIRWFLAHGPTLVYVEKEKKTARPIWYLVVMTRCNYLDRDDRCKIYLNRPKICREYTTVDCEYDDDWIFDKVFETPDQILEYAEAILPSPRKRAAVTNDCDHASGRCRRHFVVPIDPPTVWDDYDAIRWFLAHDQTLIYVQSRAWFLVVKTAIDDAGPECPVEFDWIADKVFETPEQIWDYAEAILPAQRRIKRIEPALTILSD